MQKKITSSIVCFTKTLTAVLFAQLEEFCVENLRVLKILLISSEKLSCVDTRTKNARGGNFVYSSLKTG